MDYELVRMTEEEYFKHPSVNRSQVWELFNKTPAHSRVEKTATPAMIRGKAVHSAILEPHLFHEQFAAGPDVAKNTKIWKAAEEESNKTLMKPDEFAELLAITNAVNGHSTASILLKGNQVDKEIVCLWHDPYTGLDLKARYDAMNYDTNTIIDVKTTSDASLDGFSRSIANFGYHFQDAWYTDPLESEWKFIFICVETSKPYCVALYELDDNAKQVGRAQMVEALEMYVSCRTEDVWQAYPEEVQPISLPAWYK